MKKIIILTLVLSLIAGCSSNWNISNKISLGMTKNEVREKCGKPNSFSKLTDVRGIIDRWSYYHYSAWGGYDKNIGRCDVFFYNGRVTSYQE